MSGVTKTGRRYDSRAASALMDGSIIHAAAIKVDSRALTTTPATGNWTLTHSQRLLGK